MPLGVIGKDVSVMFSGKRPVLAEEKINSFWEADQRLPTLNYLSLGRYLVCKNE